MIAASGTGGVPVLALSAPTQYGVRIMRGATNSVGSETSAQVVQLLRIFYYISKENKLILMSGSTSTGVGN